MFEIILLAYLAFRNSVRARQKGLNGWLWAGVTVGSFFTTLMIGCFVVVFNFCPGVNLELLSSTDVNVRNAVTLQLVDALKSNPLHLITIELFGIGGYLIIRYILEKKPGKKEPEVHWMDKLGKDQQ